jgi:hypothetical protein
MEFTRSPIQHGPGARLNLPVWGLELGLALGTWHEGSANVLSRLDLVRAGISWGLVNLAHGSWIARELRIFCQSAPSRRSRDGSI